MHSILIKTRAIPHRQKLPASLIFDIPVATIATINHQRVTKFHDFNKKKQMK
jgi:hypothetical protein